MRDYDERRYRENCPRGTSPGYHDRYYRETYGQRPERPRGAIPSYWERDDRERYRD